MPQHDWNIANQNFPPTRSDINNALLAAATNSSGLTAPSTPLACQWWADTTNRVMKFRNTANDAWIELFRLDDGEIVQPVTVEAVPVGTPAPWFGLTAPPKWALLDGSVLNRADYPGLFNVLGTRFNTGGETVAQFRLPDMRGRAFVGRDNMGGTAAGRVTQAISGVDGLTIGATGGHQALQGHDHDATIADFTPTLNDPGHFHPLPGQTVQSGTTGWAGAAGPFGYAGAQTAPRPTGITLTPADPTITVQPEGVGNGQNMMPCMVANWIIFTGGLGAPGDGGGGTVEPTLAPLEARQIACTDEITAITTPGEKIKLRWPYEFVPTSVRITLNSPCTTGTFTVSITVNGAAFLATVATIDAGEKSSKTAAVPPVLGMTSIPDDAEVVVNVTNVGDETATGLKLIVYGYRVVS